jgi:hypothetical protein
MARRRRRGSTSPAVRPVDVDGVRTVAVGTLLWAIAFVVLAVFRDQLAEEGLGWWLWTCLAGVGLGLLGLEYTRKRRDAIARSRLREEVDHPDDVDVVPVYPDLGATEDGDVPNEVREEPIAARAAPGPIRADQEPVQVEPEPIRADQERAQVEPEPIRVHEEPVQVAPPEPTPPEPEPSRTEAESEPVDPAPDLLLDIQPASRRARRVGRSQDRPDDDEPLLPIAKDRQATPDGRPLEGRRARHSDSLEDDEPGEDESFYRGRRARRP